ncbi:solute carrier organic anion transporter family member 4C1-like [Branchiostoma lanceolatum]|uniref:solute carrier organic anion transporter family member 4C1-like n=1 Tax=Branchiostoma lanceolatum TaxID=7740 RepID=UPI0034542656
MASVPKVRFLGIRKIADDMMVTSASGNSSSQSDLKDIQLDNGRDQVDTRYGWGPFKPDCLQVFNNPKWFLFFVSWAAFAQGVIVNGLINGALTTLEKRFQLPSSQTGLISAGYEIGFGSLCVFISYLGGLGYKPRWIATGVFLVGAGSLIFTIPHFATGPYETGLATNNLCNPRNDTTAEACSNDVATSGELSNFFYVFFFAQVLNGVGSIPLYIFGPQFLEQSLPSAASGIYEGIFLAMSYVGAGVGYILSGQLLTLYIDFDLENTKPPPGGPTDPRWLGAWWVGHLGCTCLAWLLVLPIAAYPKELPGTAMVRAAKVSEAHASTVKASNIGKGIKGFLRSLALLARTPTIVFTTVTAIGLYFNLNALATFGPKLMENQFGMTSSMAPLIFGAITLVASIVGSLVSGAVIKWKQLSVAGLLKMCIVLTAVLFLLSPGLLLKCETVELDNSSSSPVGSSCSANCACPAVYDVVCGADGKEYVSPCHAGCTSDLGGDPQVFGECSCVPPQMYVTMPGNATSEGGGMVTSGRCVSGCWQMYVFFLIFFLLGVTLAALSPPAYGIAFRSVPEHLSAFALGAQMVFVRLLGSIPSPIAIGALLDLTCELWQGDLSDDASCDSRGACWVNDRFTAGLYITLLTGGISLIMVISVILALHYYRPVDKDEDVEIETSQNTGRRSSLVVVENFGFESG